MDLVSIAGNENIRSRADGPERLAADSSLAPVGIESKGNPPDVPAYLSVRVLYGNARTGNSHHAVQASALIREGLAGHRAVALRAAFQALPEAQENAAGCAGAA
jgi:hypothetical protein